MLTFRVIVVAALAGCAGAYGGADGNYTPHNYAPRNDCREEAVELAYQLTGIRKQPDYRDFVTSRPLGSRKVARNPRWILTRRHDPIIRWCNDFDADRANMIAELQDYEAYVARGKSSAGCRNNSGCKGTRVCHNGRCVTP